MRLVNKSTQKEQIGAKIKNTFSFLKTINFTVVNVNRFQQKSLKCSVKSSWETIETCSYPMFDCAKFHSQWAQRLLLSFKKKPKTF